MSSGKIKLVEFLLNKSDINKVHIERIE